jgi:hypothetical protein
VNFLFSALEILPTYVVLVFIGGFFVLLGAVLYIVGRAVLGVSDKPARRLTQLLHATRSRSAAAGPPHTDADDR